jgi:anti-anti-sigma factor
MGSTTSQVQGGSPLSVQVSTDTPRSEARLRGALDTTTSGQLVALVDQLIADGHRDLVLDLAEVDFMGAAGLRVLVGADDALRAAGGGLVLRNVPRIVRRILEITELDRTIALE